MKNKSARLNFATKHPMWSQDVFFSDEILFNLFGMDRKKYVRWRAGEI